MRNPLTRLLALLLTLGLTAGACSSGSDDADAAASSGSNTEQEASTGTEESGADDSEQPSEEAPAALDCQEAADAAAVLRGATGTMGQLSPENEADISLDYVSIREAVDTLRAVQDLEGPIGTMREGLDNIEADLIVLEEKRYDDVAGGYAVAKINGVIVDVLC